MRLVRLCIFGKSVMLFVGVVLALFGDRLWYLRCLYSMWLCVSFVDHSVWCQWGSEFLGRVLYGGLRWRD